MKQSRQSNFELLRIILMLMIIFWHCIVHYCDNIHFTNSSIFTILLMSFSVIGVNCFISISANFGINFSFRRLISLIVQALFYSILIFIVFKLLKKEEYIIDDSLIKIITPVLHGKWWFLSTYMALFLISPFLNKGIEFLSKKQLQLIIFCLLILEILSPLLGVSLFGGDGTTLFSFITIYIIVRYISIYNIIIKRPGFIYLVSTTFLFLTTLTLLYWGYNIKAWHLFNYSSIFVVVGAISFLHIFRNIKIKNSQKINSIASLTLGVYLIHDHRSIRFLLKEMLNPILSTLDNPAILLLYLLIITFVIFTTCILIEKLRTIICNPIVNFISNLIDRKYLH